MARMLPDVDPSQLLHTSEEPVYIALRDNLTDDYVVLHSYPWLRPWRGEALVEGEADFVVLHPSRGLLVLEVKGGEIRHDGYRWFRDTKTGPSEFQDPFKQAQRNMHALMEIIQERSGRRIQKKDLVYGYAVVFPQLDYEGAPPPHAEKAIIISRSNLPFMQHAIETAYGAWTAIPLTLPYDRYRMLLNDCLMPKFRLFRPVGPEISQTSDKLLELTETQAQVFMGLYVQNRVLVEGVAGSGKTFLALHRALAFSREGKRTLFVCFNRELATWIRRQVLEDTNTFEFRDKLIIKHFHGLAAELAADAGIDFRPADGGPRTEAFWDTEVPDLMEQAIIDLDIEGREPHFDAIVVDEAQDFSFSWWYVMTQSLLSEPDGPMYAFMDPNQSLRGEINLPEIEFTSRFKLTINCRNTKRIATASASVLNLEPVIFPRSPIGSNVRVLKASSSRQQKGLVMQELRQLMQREDVHPRQIAIIGPAAKDKGSLFDLMEIDDVSLVTSAEDWYEGRGILVTTARAFKGLESEVVILYDLSAFSRLFRKEDLYVACTRAKVLLIAIVHGDQCREVITAAKLASDAEK
ncbi:Nuclease-related domain protein [anaerobic digester metagenome]